MHQWAHAVWQVSVVYVGRVGCGDSVDVFSPVVPKLYFPVPLGKLMGEGFPGHFQPGFFVLLWYFFSSRLLPSGSIGQPRARANRL